MNLEILKEKIENLLFQYWAELPSGKPSYTKWFFAEGGPQEKTADLILALRPRLELTKRRKFDLKKLS
jgi:hypothetical protein